MLNGRHWWELRRLAIAPDAPRNTASRLLCVIRRIVKQRHPDVVKLISYQDTEVHTGTIYRAAGWKIGRQVTVKQSPSWASTKKRRTRFVTPQSLAPKIRWEYDLT
jgi:hypothetical protein